MTFRSIQQGDEGEYICSHASDPDSNVKFDLVVVQPISFGDTPKTQVKDTLMAVSNIISRLRLSDIIILGWYLASTKYRLIKSDNGR